MWSEFGITLWILVAYFRHIGNGIGIIHQFSLIHFDFSQTKSIEGISFGESKLLTKYL